MLANWWKISAKLVNKSLPQGGNYRHFPQRIVAVNMFLEPIPIEQKRQHCCREFTFIIKALAFKECFKFPC
jgi:hypothetical protein